MIRVYRVEDSHGNGPYNSRYSTEAEILLADTYLNMHEGCKCHPLASSEVEGFKRWNRSLSAELTSPRSGFRTIKQLQRWFQGLGVPLIEAGFCVSVYEVATKHTDIGSSGQTLFLRGQSKLVRTQSIDKVLGQSYHNPHHSFPTYEDAQQDSYNLAMERAGASGWTPGFSSSLTQQELLDTVKKQEEMYLGSFEEGISWASPPKKSLSGITSEWCTPPTSGTSPLFGKGSWPASLASLTIPSQKMDISLLPPKLPRNAVGLMKA